MSYTQSVIKLSQGDTLPPVNLTVQDSEHPLPGLELDRNDPKTWARINLSTVERVILLFSHVDDYSDPAEIECKIMNHAKGMVRVEWEEGDLDQPGDYEGMLRVLYRDDISELDGLPPRLLQWTSTVKLKFEILPLFQ